MSKDRCPDIQNCAVECRTHLLNVHLYASHKGSCNLCTLQHTCVGANSKLTHGMQCTGPSSLMALSMTWTSTKWHCRPQTTTQAFFINPLLTDRLCMILHIHPSFKYSA